ncbi:hypothetical protein GF312_00840 [Candidatus Poribacteria bacterium]|nr:hypothetical protein [Candidatus Poribacteria bacterium]
MTFLERVKTVLNRQKPDKVPFAPYDNLIPRGDFEREMRNRGMGLCARRSSVGSRTPDVWSESFRSGDIIETIYHTPVGDVSTKRRTHLGRLSDSGSVQLEWMIKDIKDYETVIFMIDNAQFYSNDEGYNKPLRQWETDGIVRGSGLTAPYDSTEGYFGLFKWGTEQYDHPDHFSRLLDALERRAERMFPYVADSPADFIAFGGLSGSYSPKQYEKYILPFYRKYIPILREKGKICAMHAHASNLWGFRNLLAAADIDVIEAFTPPPIGDLSIAEARKAWGNDTVIWVNFPETVFLSGPEATKEYTIDLIKSDPPGLLVIGMTELGLYGVADEYTENAFKEGIKAIMDAIDECAF